MLGTTRQGTRLFGALAVIAAAAAGCSSSDTNPAAPNPSPSSDAGADANTPDGDTTDSDGGTDAQLLDSADNDANDAGGRALVGGDPAMTADIQGEEGYWYSRYSMSTLAMMSGLGDVIDPSDASDPYAGMVMQAMPKLIDMANDCMAADSSCVPPTDPATSQPMAQVPSNVLDMLHPALLKRVYNEGDPSLANAFDSANPMDTLNMRFVTPSSAAAPTRTAAYGWLAIKEVEWARQFHVDEHFGAPGQADTKPLAMIRFFGEVIYAEALMQTKVLLDDTIDMSANPPVPKTPVQFDWSDPSGNYTVLLALADLSTSLTGNPAKGNVLCTTDTICSATNRYRAMGDMMAPMVLGPGKTVDDLAGMMLGAANMLMQTPMIPDPPPDLRSAAVATQAYTWLAAAETDSGMRDAVKTRLRSAADTVLAKPKVNSVEQAAALRALIEASRVLGDAKYKAGALDAWSALEAAYDPAHGVWTDVSSYDADDLAFLFGALNAISAYQGDAIGASNAQKQAATTMLTDSFEATMDLGGFQIAAPPDQPPFVPAAEHQPTALHHRYPTMPMPSMVSPSTAGHGVAPVPGKSVTWNNGAWSVDRSSFESGPAMHLANEMLWFHSDEVNGFPTVP